MCVHLSVCASVCLCVERSLEDHENVVHALAHWPKGNTSNQILFRNNPDKFLLLQRPQLFVPTSHIYASGAGTSSKSYEIFSEEKKKQILLKVLMYMCVTHTRTHTHTHTHIHTLLIHLPIGNV